MTCEKFRGGLSDLANAKCIDETIQTYGAPFINAVKQLGCGFVTPTFKLANGIPMIAFKAENIAR